MTINTNPYCEVKLPTLDSVTRGPFKLKQNYQDQNGQWNYNIWDDDVYTDQQRLDIGLYPYIESDAGAPGPYYDRSLSGFVINPTNVVRNAIYAQWDIERVKQVKDQEMLSQLRAYTTNEAAINPRVNEYVQNDYRWYTDKQAELARITDWAEAAAFDTSYPKVLPLSNSVVGRTYVDQGLRMQKDNDAAAAQSLPAPWDPMELSGFITANNLAANDVSDNTPPVQPGYKIRQGVAVISEQFARIVIFRESRDDPNPALQTTYKIRILDREDSRDLYVFSYTNGTYLIWHRFADIGRNMWEVEAHSSEWQYVPLDMAFIFSYGTNPAVEADYFTDRVEFEAGIQTKQILVAWDTDPLAVIRGRGRAPIRR